MRDENSLLKNNIKSLQDELLKSNQKVSIKYNYLKIYYFFFMNKPRKSNNFIK